MGWTFFHKGRQTAGEWFREYLTWENDQVKVKPLKTAIVNLREAYAAVETVYKVETEKHKPGDRKVWAAVFMLDYRPKDSYDFGYKDMDESMGPYLHNCPEGILELLTPTDSGYANEWRERCWARASKPKVKKGVTVRFKDPVRLTTGSEYQLFRCLDKRRNMFQVITEEGKPQGRVKLRNWLFRDREYTIMEAVG